MRKHWRASRVIDLLFRVGAWPKKRLVKISGDEWFLSVFLSSIQQPASTALVNICSRHNPIGGQLLTPYVINSYSRKSIQIMLF